MEKRNSQCEHGLPMEQTRGVFCKCESDVARYYEFNVRSVLHRKVSLSAVNHIYVIHEVMNGSKKSL